MTKQFIKNLLSLVAGEIGTRIMTLLLTIYIARHFGVGAFGQLSFAQVISTYLGLLVTFGLNTVGIREISRDTANSGKTITAVFHIRMFSGITGFIVLLLLFGTSGTNQSTTTLVTAYGLSTIVQSLLDVSWIFNAYSLMNITAGIRVLQQLVYFGFSVLFLAFWKSLYIFPVAMVLASLITFVVSSSILVGRKDLYRFRQLIGRLDRTMYKGIARAGAYIFISAVLVQLYFNFDTVILQMYHGEKVVGIYNAAYKIVTLLTGLPSIIVSAVFPLLSKISDAVDRRASLQSLLGLMVIISLPICVGGQLVGTSLITGMYGEDYAGASNALRILLIAVVLVYVNFGLGHFLLSLQKEKTFMAYVFIGAIVNVTLNLLLIPRYGIMAAAWTTVAAELVVFSGYITAAVRLGYLTLKISWVTRFVSCLILFSLLVFVMQKGLNVWAVIPTSIVIYLILICIFHLSPINIKRRKIPIDSAG